MQSCKVFVAVFAAVLKLNFGFPNEGGRPNGGPMGAVLRGVSDFIQIALQSPQVSAMVLLPC